MTGLNVRPLEERDISSITDYFLNADKNFLLKMSVDVSKLPEKKAWEIMMTDELKLPFNKKSTYYLIWEQGGLPLGHSNINRITFGREAFMHLHIWNSAKRKSGIGQLLVRKSIPYYLQHFELKKLLCEPNAYNEAPNRTLPKVGFRFIKSYDTTPGPINLFQTVNRWELSSNDYKTS